MEDYYKILGIAKNASDKEIKDAYRNLAKQHHPDKNPGDKSAEEKFKKISEAYDVLSNPDKRQSYDNPSPNVNIEDLFKGHGKFWEEMMGRTRGPQVKRGRDVSVVIQVTLEEIENKVAKDLLIKIPIECKVCSGRGGVTYDKCSKCNGLGQILQNQGFIQTYYTCFVCSGSGVLLKDICQSCQGRGNTQETQKVNVALERGILPGNQKRLTGLGEKVNNGVTGDLLITFEVLPHPIFSMNSAYDLKRGCKLNLTKALLGTDVEIEDLCKNKIKLTIPPLTKDKTLFRIPKHGRFYPKSDLKGNLYVEVEYDLPAQLDKQQIELLQKLAETNL